MLKLSVLFLLLLWIYCQSSLCQDASDPKVTIVGTGSGFAYIIHRAWSITYSNQYPDIEISYIPNEGVFQNVTTTIVLPNFGATELPVTNQSFIEYPDLTLFPLTAGAMVLMTNIQNLSELKTPLILSRKTTVGIFSGAIQYWDDPDILADNQDNGDIVSSLPHFPIQIIVPKRSSLTVAFTSALESFDDSWNSTFLVWPQNITDNWILPPVYSANAFDSLTKVLSLNNTVAYVPYSIALFVQASYAKMINKFGNVVTADPDNQKAAQAGATFDDKHFASILDAPGADAWPLTMFSYGMVSSSTGGNCTHKRETLKYFIWALHDDATIVGDTLGFTALPESISQMTRHILESLECDGEKILAYEYQPQHESAIPEAIFWINMILLVATIVIGISMKRLGGFATKILGIYTALVLAGAIVSYVSAIFWYLVPTEDWICCCRFWLSTMGFTLLLAAMFARTWQFFKVYNTIEVKGTRNFEEIHLAGNLTRKVFGWFEYTGGIAAVAGIQLLILIVKQAIDPWNAAITVTNDIQYEAVWRCNSDYDTLWVYLEITFFSLLLLFGLYVVYRTWSWDGMRVESRWLLISIYNVIFVGLSVQLLAVKEENMTDDSLGLYAQILIAVTTSNMVSAVTVPMFFASLWKKIQATFTQVSVTELDLLEDPRMRYQTQHPPPSPYVWNNNNSPPVSAPSSLPPSEVPKQNSTTPYYATPDRKIQSAMEHSGSVKPPMSVPGSRSEIVQRIPN